MKGIVHNKQANMYCLQSTGFFSQGCYLQETLRALTTKMNFRVASDTHFSHDLQDVNGDLKTDLQRKTVHRTRTGTHTA